MKLILDDEDILKLIYYCLCDGGAREIQRSDIEFTYKQKEYNEAKKNLENNKEWKDCIGKTIAQGGSVCFEDVLVQMVREGNSLVFVDLNQSPRKRIELTLQSARVGLEHEGSVKEKAIKEVLEQLSEDGNTDMWTGYNLLQWMLFGELIYG